jgi:hypothetical protein
MRVIILNWFLLGIGAGVAWGQRPAAQPVRAIPIASHAQPNRATTSITFLPSPNGAPVRSLGPDHGVLDLGSISYFLQPGVRGMEIQRQKDSFIVSSSFDLRIDFSSGRRADTATVSAYLLIPNPLGTIWVDGVRLSMTPGIIGKQHYGAIREHILKIAVPISMPAAQLLDSIGVMVTPN